MENFLSRNEWARNPEYDHFWSHYAVCQQWMKQHSEAFRQVQSQHGQTTGDESEDVDEEIQEPEVTERLSRCGIRDEDELEVAKEPEIEEMSDEMKDFFAKTKEHRQKLKAQRIAEKQKEASGKPWLQENEEEYVNVEQISVRGRGQNTAQHRDANAEFMAKRENAKKLYGDAAEKILSLESAMEMKFESEYAKNPPMWPNIPLRF
ncbi:unnamed protein product [Caenorhabditis sp. 36 PRJEB53466]|nr:unnamed protein product [Caenorhabditis sp. 36 PRJEB53466]